jgi:integrase/recombinase XerC
MSNFADNTARPARTLTEREIVALLRTSGQRRDGFRDHVIVSIALGTGLREHEILALDVGDVFDIDGHARRHVKLRVFKRASEHPAPQEIALNDTVRAKLDRLLRLRRAAGEELGPHSPIFVSRLGRRLSKRRLREMFALWQERAGLERRFNFHALRHTACAAVYRRTKDIRLTQRFARHRSIQSTAIYTHPSDDELVQAVQELPC